MPESILKVRQPKWLFMLYSKKNEMKARYAEAKENSYRQLMKSEDTTFDYSTQFHYHKHN